MPSSLVSIPRQFLHIDLDDLAALGVPETSRAALRALLADLALVPDASSSAQLVGPPSITLPCLAVLARHVGQGLRDQNLSIAHDRRRLRAERAKLVFLTTDALAEVIALGDDRPMREAVLFVSDPSAPSSSVLQLLLTRQSAGVATFLATPCPIAVLNDWRLVELSETPIRPV